MSSSDQSNPNDIKIQSKKIRLNSSNSKVEIIQNPIGEQSFFAWALNARDQINIQLPEPE